MFVIVAAGHVQGNGAAANVGGKLDLDVGFPAEVVDIVVMEVDGAVLFGALPVVVGLAIPVRSAHRAPADGIGGMQAVGSDIDRTIGLDLTAEMPARDDVLRKVGRQRKRAQSFLRLDRMDAGQQDRSFDFAIEMRPDAAGVLRLSGEVEGPRPGLRGHRSPRFGVAGIVDLRETAQIALRQSQLAGVVIERDRDRVPLPDQHGLAGRGFHDRSVTGGNPSGKRALRRAARPDPIA
nr:hypothetical protein [Bradyrhizobium sp. USDA 3458]